MELQNIRDEINRIDDELLPLFLKRMELSSQVAQVKKEKGLPLYVPAREREILSHISSKSGNMDDYARIIYNTLFELSRSYQSRVLESNSPSPFQNLKSEEFPTKAIVACQGIEGAYSQLAADKAFRFADIMYLKSFEAVFQAVERGLCQFGILPIENSSHGSVSQVYNLMRSHHFSIVRTVKLHINHHLLAKKGVKLEQIRSIVSHDQAIGQCSTFLSGLQGVRTQLCENTAVAAQMVAESADPGIAAISSEECAEIYKLDILLNRIQNTDNNYTRFIIIQKEEGIYPGADKISLMFSVPNSPGSLSRIMSRFSCLSLNLTKLESRPVEGSDFHYIFYVDLEASPENKDVQGLIASLSKELKHFVFLGAYREI